MDNSMTERDRTGFLDCIERAGNKIPHPFILFCILTLILALVSFAVSQFGITAVNPSDGELIEVRNVLSSEGLEYILLNLVPNFSSFEPLGTVIVITLGIGVAEEVGLISAFMRKSILGASPKVVTFMIMLIGIMGNLASDAASIVIPGIAGMIFLSIGKNPVVGIVAAYVATSAGFTANLVIAGTDSLLVGITNEAVSSSGLPEMPATCNWYFMAVSTVLLALTGTFVTVKFIEPRAGKCDCDRSMAEGEITPEENRALRSAGICLAVFVLTVAVLAYPEDSFLRNPDTGSLVVKSNLFRGIVPMIFLLFLSTGICYGVSIGKIEKAADVPAYMSESMKKMSSFIVSTFIIAQFIALFSWTNLGILLAAKGAKLLESAGFVGIPLFICFILLTSAINIFIGSGSAKWSILAPIFVPMFGIFNLSPAFTQAIYRIGDSATNVISPMHSDIPILLGYMNKYDEDAGIGTLFSITFPYAIAFLAVWIVQMAVWYIFDLPLGPGVDIFL